jgi:hypothetical protein
MLGTNAVVCLVAIPLLSIVPLAAILYVMRNGAPTSARRAGAAAGCLAAAVGAAAYAIHCPDDSPLFVAVWYSLAFLLVLMAGAAAGARVLRW